MDTLIKPTSHVTSTPPRTYITNARLILPDAIVEAGTLLLAEGVIVAICPDRLHGHAEEIDLEGDTLMPGLIDLHGDAIEREMEPREGARLPLTHAVAQGDRKCAMAGITTAYHALAFVGERQERRSHAVMNELARLIHTRNAQLRIDNRVHCRFEMTRPNSQEFIHALIDEGICEMLSLNNHAPGQGQYRDLDLYRKYLKTNYNLPDTEVDRIIAERVQEGAGAENHADAMADYGLKAGIPLASHDDVDAERVHLRHRQGSTISEFPLTIDAARTATELGMHAIVGSPNVMRGGSTGTGASALELIGLGIADCLCSDYAPSTLLPAIFRIAEHLDWPLYRAVNIATKNPAQAANLTDRGSIVEGQRADLIAVRYQHEIPLVQRLWSQGHLMLRFH